MKRFCILLIFLSVSFLCFAKSGVLSGVKKLSVASTRHFDIIFPEDCKLSAALLYENADAVYDELATAYNLQADFRMPVVITPAVQDFNAYFAEVPYNHIVLYDTASTQSLNVFSESFLSTFRHELTHAISFNSRSEGLARVDRILGDGVTGDVLTLTSGWAEGAAVSSESQGGEGRLNDEYFLQLIKQAKLEGNFPSYADAQGARDVYPVGMFYYFNGAFDKWLQDKYGMDKYAEFWYTCVNFIKLTAGGAFKKVYGTAINYEWEQFAREFKVPEGLAPNPVASGDAMDFFERDSSDYSILNNSGARYSNLVMTDKGLFFTDNSRSAVFFVPAAELSSKKIRPKRLFSSKTGITHLSASSDGSFLAVEFNSYTSGAVKRHLKLYDVERHSFRTVSIDGFQEAAIIRNGGGYFVVGQKFNGRENQIWIFNAEDYKNPLKSLVRLELPLEVFPYSFCDIGGGHFAFIKKDGLCWSVCTASLDGAFESQLPAPGDNVRLRGLSFADGRLYFSYAEPGSMPRLGSLELAASSYWLSGRDLSGGIYSPVCAGGQFFYIGSFYLESRLLCLASVDEGKIMPAQADLAALSSSVSASGYPLAGDFKLPDWELKGYNPLRFYTRGLLLPVSQLSSASFDSEHNGGTYSLPWGITYATSSPWTKDILTLSAAYGHETNSFGAGAGFSSGTDTPLLSYSGELFSEFDFSGFKQARASASVSSSIYFGQGSSLFASFSSLVHYGRSNKSAAVYATQAPSAGGAAAADANTYFYAEGAFSLGYASSLSTGAGAYERLGFDARVFLKERFAQRILPENHIFANGWNLGLAAGFSIPRLVPVRCRTGFTYNLPLSVGAYLFASPSLEGIEFGMYQKAFSMASVRAEAVLFAWEIQRAVPFATAFFVREFKLSAVYTAGADLPKSELDDSWRLFHLGTYADYIRSGEAPVRQQGFIKAGVSSALNIGQLMNYDYTMELYLMGGFDNLSNGVFRPSFGAGIRLAI